ncbi:MAG: hypothetical protein IT457_21985 [Planctomycetes bacterium]|nr:hypothetical protein [Planctomycetota bacterium]
MTRLVVLYEDARAAAGRFGPHELLLGCVADELGRRLHDLRKEIVAIPMNGVAKLLAALTDAERWQRVAPRGAPLLALIDSDRIRDHVPPEIREHAGVEAWIRARFSEPARLTVILLDRNLETVIAAIRDCGEAEVQLVESALRKDLNARDRLLGKLGADSDRRALRDCVRGAVPSFERAVAAATDALR